MQAQSIRNDVQTITHSQSLVAVQTLLRAGLGCITFLRDLLPADNFNECHFTTSEDSLASQSSDSYAISSDKRLKRNVSGFKIMGITRGYSDEADKLMNFLEKGIFDALQRQYLRSFIFAIYLDNKDPTNIIEAYTFNFHYHTIPGTDTVIPIMSLGEGLTKMSLKETKRHLVDPIAEAAKKGKAPTNKDVKKSVKALLRTLIQCMTQMDVLPKRRFVTFKTFYTDDTPPDYEPPHFQAGDVERDRWFFMTHDLDEVPDQWNVGKVDTSHHAVNISVTSVATYLPSSTINDNAIFTGTTTCLAVPPTLTPVQEASLRMLQTEKQLEDAKERNIVWAADNVADPDAGDSDVDADGVEDTDYVKRQDGGYDRVNFHDSMVPVGLRNEAGDIQPMDVDEAHFGGVSETVPTRLTEMNATKNVDIPDLDQTQPLDSSTQDLPQAHSPADEHQASVSNVAGGDFFGVDGDVSFSNSALPPSDRASTLASPLSSMLSSQGSNDIDTQMLKNMACDGGAGMTDMYMLDMETQTIPSAEAPSMESIESFGPNNVDDIDQSISNTPKAMRARPSEDGVKDVGRLECECGVPIEDACCFCEGGCDRWYHLWCMGYHSVKDNRMPVTFICFDCRVRGDISWEFIKVDLYPKMLSKFKELALFRRAIKIAETKGPGTPAEFAKLIGCDNILARQLFKRLEIEGFIVEQTTIENGSMETRPRSVRGKGKAKSKQTKHRKNIQKPKFFFNRLSKSGVGYADYFNPDQKVEGRMLGLPELKASFKSHSRLPVVRAQNTAFRVPSPQNELESQTQDETQFPLLPTTPLVDLKRTMKADGDIRLKKKMKISVTPAVDLAE